MRELISNIQCLFLKFTEKFESFGVSAREFYCEAHRRCNDLLDTGRKGKMFNYLNQFKHSISMLVMSFTIALKYPRNHEAAASKDFAFNQVCTAEKFSSCHFPY